MTDHLTSTEAGSSKIRRFHHSEFPIDRILSDKGSSTVSVCLPARNEESTVGEIVETIRADLAAPGVVDEIVVIDDHSVDSTAKIAAEAGAEVVSSADILEEFGPGHGKGEALWKSLQVTSGDLVVWCDADISEFGPRFVQGIIGALICEPGVDMAKGHYRRPEREREGGGRVTELVARPMLSLFYPELAGLYQPLSGEYGGRREVLECLPFVGGYGVEVGLLIDYVERFSVSGLVQVDLDIRHHRNRALTQLGPQALAICQTILRHVDADLVPSDSALIHPDRTALDCTLTERPPMIEVSSYHPGRCHLHAVET